MSALDRALVRFERALVLGPRARRRPARPRPAPDEPGSAPGRSLAVRLVGSASAIGLPVALGLALVPIRTHLVQSVSLLMVLPVLLVALLAGARLASLTAIVSAATFGLLHTEPYGRATIDDADDIVEMVVLLVVGVVTGFLAESAQRAVAASRVRRQELSALTVLLGHIGSGAGSAEVLESSRRCVGSLLGAADVSWRPDYHGGAGPVLHSDGSLSGAGSDVVHLDAETLPTMVEVPVGSPPTELGRFVVRSTPGRIVSVEERRAAVVVAGLLAHVLTR